MIAAWNDYCDTDLGGGWMGLAYSLDHGETWTPSRIPGYPTDTSAEGVASPLHGRHAEAGDPCSRSTTTAGSLPEGSRSTGSIRRTAMSGWRPTALSRTRAIPEGLHPHGRRRHRNPGTDRHLRGQARARGRPDGRSLRRERLHLLVAVRRCQRQDEDLVQPIDRFRPDLFEPDRALVREGRAGLRHRHRARR